MVFHWRRRHGQWQHLSHFTTTARACPLPQLRPGLCGAVPQRCSVGSFSVRAPSDVVALNFVDSPGARLFCEERVGEISRPGLPRQCAQRSCAMPPGRQRIYTQWHHCRLRWGPCSRTHSWKRERPGHAKAESARARETGEDEDLFMFFLLGAGVATHLLVPFFSSQRCMCHCGC